MSFQNFRKGLFATKSVSDLKPTNADHKEKITYRDYGFSQASALRGNLPGLKVCLQKLYFNYRQEVQQDTDRQDELKKPLKVKIEEYKGHNNTLHRSIEKCKAEDIPKAKKKIELLKEELGHIRKNPHEVSGDSAGKAGFWIGCIILAFLTVYLFMFYSSASYSAFFKTFTVNELGLANSIFDAQALTKALNDGITELVLILTIPFVFLGLGYLIHKFQQQKSIIKFFKIALLILVTFVFDSILAYEITEKIYNINAQNSLSKTYPEYSVELAYSSISFWLIIFAGFIVYLIWGFVFDFVMDAYMKMDRVKIALDEKKKEIKDAQMEINELEAMIDKSSTTIGNNEKEISKLQKSLEGTLIPRDFEQDIYQFMAGWLAWMEQANKPHNEINVAESTVSEFLSLSFDSLVTNSTN